MTVLNPGKVVRTVLQTAVSVSTTEVTVAKKLQKLEFHAGPHHGAPDMIDWNSSSAGRLASLRNAAAALRATAISKFSRDCVDAAAQSIMPQAQRWETE